MIAFIHCVRRFAPALPLRGISLREDGLREATDAVLTHHHNQPISAVWASIWNSPRLHLNNRRDLSKVQGQLKLHLQLARIKSTKQPEATACGDV